MAAAEVKAFFAEFVRLAERGIYTHRPWVGFSERPFHSAKLNIDDAVPLPVQRSTEPPSSQGAANAVGSNGIAAIHEKTIWLFGDSTMFGWGVPDEQTIASHLS